MRPRPWGDLRGGEGQLHKTAEQISDQHLGHINPISPMHPISTRVHGKPTDLASPAHREKIILEQTRSSPSGLSGGPMRHRVLELHGWQMGAQGSPGAGREHRQRVGEDAKARRGVVVGGWHDRTGWEVHGGVVLAAVCGARANEVDKMRVIDLGWPVEAMAWNS